MENINNIRNEAPPVIYNQDDITRCVECNLICSLKLNIKKEIHTLIMNVKMVIMEIFY